MNTKRYCVGVAKRYLLQVVSARDDWREFLHDFDGTREDALQALRDDPRDVFIGDCDRCERKADGSCSGREVAS